MPTENEYWLEGAKDTFVNDADEALGLIINGGAQFIKIAGWTDYNSVSDGNDPDYYGFEKFGYNMSAINVDYTNLLKGNEMPLEFLLSLLYVGGGEDEFVSKVADLVLNSEIEIGILDRVHTEISTYIDTYTKETRAEVNSTVVGIRIYAS